MAAAGSSRFTVTCGLMRQYMRDHQQQQQGGAAPAALSLLLLAPPSEATETDARTMQLFPATAPSIMSQPPRTTAPLTIFYDGRVVVVDDFPAEKARALMQLAASEPEPESPEPAKKVAAPPAVPETAALSDLPVARKASLQRFLQKRKHRISATDPYHNATAEKAAAAKPVKDAAVKPEPSSWLDL